MGSAAKTLKKYFNKNFKKYIIKKIKLLYKKCIKSATLRCLLVLHRKHLNFGNEALNTKYKRFFYRKKNILQHKYLQNTIRLDMNKVIIMSRELPSS